MRHAIWRFLEFIPERGDLRERSKIEGSSTRARPCGRQAYFEELIFIIDNSAEIFSEPEREHLRERLRLDRARILSAWGESEEVISMVTPLVGDAWSIALMREAVLILATVHADAGELERARKVLEAYQNLFRDAECPPRTKRRFLARLADVLVHDGNLPRVQQLVELCDTERDEVGVHCANSRMYFPAEEDRPRGGYCRAQSFTRDQSS